MSELPPSTKKPALSIIEGGDKRREIRITQEILSVAREAADVLAEDSDIYKRAGALVHVIMQDSITPGGRRTQAIRDLPHAMLLVHLSQGALWLKFDGKSSAYKRVAAPAAVVNAVHTMGEWPKVRPLTSVINAPTMRPNGTVLQRRGYDDETGILYSPSRSFAEVPLEPTQQEAKEAADRILDYACDFPFATPADRSAWLSTVLTLVARGGIAGEVPLFAIDGNSPGVGKSRLVDLAHVIAFGTHAPRSSLSRNDEEMRKQITSLLLAGVNAVLVDNVDKGFGGPAIDALLTSRVWTDRELGRSAIRTVPALAVWFVTGNNMQLIGDLVRRTLRIRVETDLEKPELRSGFRWGEGEKLFKAADRARPILVRDALTIIRAYVHTGRPLSNSSTWGSYESWARVVVDPLRWIGMADPLDVRASNDDANVDTSVLAAQAIAQFIIDIGRTVSARELITALYPPNRFDGDGNDAYPSMASAREMLESATVAHGVPDLIRVGHFLKRFRNRKLPGKVMLTGELDSHAKIIRWGVRDMNAKGDAKV